MADVPTFMWKGNSGKQYQYWIYSLSDTSQFKAEPGNYIFAKQAISGWSAGYIGQTENLGDRLADHEKESCAKRYGAAHIHAHLTSGGEAVRKEEEKDLIQKHDPPCNKQFT